jgi:hypothetical protein
MKVGTIKCEESTDQFSDDYLLKDIYFISSFLTGLPVQQRLM